MELALAVLAVVSLLTALGMGAVTWRLLAAERRRSAARIAALVAALGDDEDDDGDRDRAAQPSPASSSPAAAAPAPDWPPRIAGPAAAAGVRAPGWPPRVAGLAAAAGLLLAVVLVAAIGLREAGRDGPDAAAAPAPVELLALEHEAVGAVLAIRGSVRAADASATSPLAVLATAFDDGGAAVARGRVDLPALAPGAASPFAVEVPAAGVSRYRISFLRDEVAVPHVDRRASAQLDDAAAEMLGAAGGAS